MALFVRSSWEIEQTKDEAAPSGTLAERAGDLLHKAAGIEPDNPDHIVEERAVWQPDSWMLQQCWQMLAKHGYGEEAMAVAALLEKRNPLAPVQALYQVARRADDYPHVAQLVAGELGQLHVKLFGAWVVSDETRQVERLMLAAASAALIGDAPGAFACLERLDQLPRAWDRVFLRTELRDLLAETIAQVGLHPLVNHLITGSIRRYEELGAQFLHRILTLIGPKVSEGGRTARLHGRLLLRCVETFQYATLTTLNSRRLAAIAFAQAGRADAILEQIVTMANVQEARRSSGLTGSQGDPYFLRQVKRPNANADVDFQLYTLQEAIRAMPVRSIARERRISLADRVASLAVQSDGWTAAGAATTLIELGALKYAIDIVDHITPTDPTRSEGVISLVRGLLAFGEPQLAQEQVDKALNWIKTLDRRNPERATIWGLGEVYLEFGRPDLALKLLDHRYATHSLAGRLTKLFNNTLSDDKLRDNRLRLQALIHMHGRWSDELQTLYAQLKQWAPRLLEGEALVNFYVDGMLRPLLSIGKLDLVWELLPQIRAVLAVSSGDKHAVHVARVADLLAQRLVPRTVLRADDGALPTGDVPARSPAPRATSAPGVLSGDGQIDDRESAASEPDQRGDEKTPGSEEDGGPLSEPREQEDLSDRDRSRQARDLTHTVRSASIPGTRQDAAQAKAILHQFLSDLWEIDTQRGIWQVVHGIEGSLDLLLALEGPQALQDIALTAANEGGMWSS